MNAYFDNELLQQRLLYHAAQWIGTPFIPHAAIEKAGVDCVNLVAQIYIACGFLKKFNPPKYTLQEGKHARKSKVVEWIEQSGSFEKVEWPAIGDALCFQFRQAVEHHVGLKLDRDKFLHVMERRKVEIASLNDFAYRRTLRSIYRPIIA